MALISTTHFSAISLLPLQSGSWAYKACETEEDSCHSGHQPGNVDETEKENAGNNVVAATSSAAPKPFGEGADGEEEGDRVENGNETGQAVEVGGDGAPAGGGEAVGGGVGKSPLGLISAPFRALAGKLKGGFRRVLGANRLNLDRDKTAVYRFAAYVDNICGVLLFIGYIVAMAVILAVYS